MAYDEGLAERLRECLAGEPMLDEKKMFGGIAFMVNGHMTCGVVDEALMARVGPRQYAEALARPHAREMDFTGRPLRGFVYVSPEAITEDEELVTWVRTCLAFVHTLPPK